MGSSETTTYLGRTIAIDFDRVIHGYQSGMVELEKCPDPPVPGALEFVKQLLACGYTVTVFSCRARTLGGVVAIVQYLDKHGFPPVWDVTDEKPRAGLYIDDRGFRFTGTFPSIEEVDRLCSNPGKP